MDFRRASGRPNRHLWRQLDLPDLLQHLHRHLDRHDLSGPLLAPGRSVSLHPAQPASFLPRRHPGAGDHDEPEPAGGQRPPARPQRLPGQPEGRTGNPPAARKNRPPAVAPVGADDRNPGSPARSAQRIAPPPVNCAPAHFSIPTTMNLALFDLDNTLLAGDSDFEWAQFLISRGVVDREVQEAKNIQFYEQYKAGTLDIYEFLAFQLAPL